MTDAPVTALLPALLDRLATATQIQGRLRTETGFDVVGLLCDEALRLFPARAAVWGWAWIADPHTPAGYLFRDDGLTWCCAAPFEVEQLWLHATHAQSLDLLTLLILNDAGASFAQIAHWLRQAQTDDRSWRVDVQTRYPQLSLEPDRG